MILAVTLYNEVLGSSGLLPVSTSSSNRMSRLEELLAALRIGPEDG